MAYTARFSEEVKLLAVIDPVSTAAQVNSAWVSVAEAHRLVAKFMVGAIAATGTLTVRIQQAKDGTGTGAKALKTDVALADTDDNKQRWIECRAEEIDQDGGFSFVRLEAVAATAASVIAAELLGIFQRYKPPVQPATLTVVP